MSLSLPIHLVRYQGPMIKTLGEIFLSSILPDTSPKQNPERIDDVNVVLPAPEKELVDLYKRWCTYSIQTENGHPPLESPNTLPPHLFSQFALAICAKQLKQLRYRLINILNQGVGLEVHHPIPLGEPLHIKCKMLDIVEEEGRAKIHQQLQIGTQSEPHCCTASFHTVFILGKSIRKKIKENAPEFHSIGKWTVSPNDGFNFALLTGDFNPIHWVGLAARFSPFKQKVLHGFGMFTRTIETIQAQEQKPIQSIQVRFISPAFLDGRQVEVLLSDADENNVRKVELKSADGSVLMIGDITI